MMDADLNAHGLGQAITRIVDTHAAAEKAGTDTTTVGTNDLTLLLRTFATLFRKEVRNARAR